MEGKEQANKTDRKGQKDKKKREDARPIRVPRWVAGAAAGPALPAFVRVRRLERGRWSEPGRRGRAAGRVFDVAVPSPAATPRAKPPCGDTGPRRGTAGEAAAAGPGSPGATGTGSRAQALGSPAACGSRPGNASPSLAALRRDPPQAQLEWGAVPGRGSGVGRGWMLTCGRAAEETSYFAPLAPSCSLIIGGGVGGRGHFLPAPIFVSGDAGTNSLITALSSHGIPASLPVVF